MPQVSINTGGFKFARKANGRAGYLWPRTPRAPATAMNELAQRVQRIGKHLRHLVQERDDLLERLAGTEAIAQERHRNMEVLTQRVAGLERENEVLRLARSLPEGKGRDTAKQRIDELVDEIDRCLRLIKA